jgi:hypothetical protein
MIYQDTEWGLLQEEAGIRAPLRHAGVLLFLTDETKWAFHIDIFTAEDYTGTITEYPISLLPPPSLIKVCISRSEEMKPEWFSTNTSGNSELPGIPFDRMWEDDVHWMPLLLSRLAFAGRVDFTTTDGQSSPSKWWFGTVQQPSN